MRKLAPIIAALALFALLLSPAGAAGKAPPGFVGISPQTPATDEDFELMRKAGIRSVRVPFFWSHIERFHPRRRPPDWADVDRTVRIAAEHGLQIFPFVWGTPPWISADAHREPSFNRRGLRAWATFLHRSVRRYGSNGAFWRQNRDLPRLPVRAWELWNEPNIVSFSRRSSPERFARLIRAGGRAVHRADRGAQVILGGLFGQPLQIPPNVAPDDFLDRVYRVPGLKHHFDGVGLHPYVAAARGMRPQIIRLRRVMHRHGDARAKIYMTEMGWGSHGFQSRWERGPRGQARELHRAFAMLVHNRFRWRIGGVWWFSWMDIQAGCQFCDSAGLLTRHRTAKPAWYRFNRWTGGDPGIVRRARFGD